MPDPSVALAARRRIDELIQRNDELQRSRATLLDLNASLRTCLTAMRKQHELHRENEPNRWLISACVGAVLATLLLKLVW